MGLADSGHLDPFVLTKGSRQRVAVASTLATKPEVIILDEPTTGLDHRELLGMMALIRRLNEQGHTILIITHAMAVAAEYARRVILMRDGRIVRDGSTREIFADEDDTEPMGGSILSPDAKDLGLGTLRLRAERKTNSDGRVYLIVVRTTDASGNASFDCTTATVPLRNDAKAIAAVDAQASMAKAHCLAHGGAPPPNYFVSGDGPVIGKKQ